MDNRFKIVVIHHNTLCCLAMRTILTDIAPFVDMFRDVEVVSFNSFEEFTQQAPIDVIHYFISEETLAQNGKFFGDLSRRCIVLTEGKSSADVGNFRCIDIHCPERELLKSFLMMQNTAHHAHGMEHHSTQEEAELLSQREKEVLALIVKGYINKEIADMLNISTPTVIFHRRNISEKIGSRAIGRQTIYAVMNGIVDVKEL
ncbi:MAG: LuxR family transcriptional regulator [Alistipes sp.]|nr:LuxR family transcriptional regulator [Alistipes sp.]